MIWPASSIIHNMSLVCQTRYFHTLFQMTGIPWNPLKKQVGNLAAKPQLTQGLASHEEERKLELSYVQLQDLEDNSKKLYKEVKKYEECLTGLQRQEEKVASDLSNSTVCQENPKLRRLAE